MTASRRTGRFLLLGAVAAALSMPAVSAPAGEVADRAAEAEKLAGQGKSAEALTAFGKATDALLAALPLGIRTAVFASSVEGYGRYAPRAEGPFRSGEVVTLYVEPVAFGFGGAAPQVTVTLSVGIEVRTPGGLTLAQSDDVGRLEWQGRVRAREIHAALNVTLPELKPGSYALRVTLSDAASGRNATADLPFKVAG